MNKFQTRGHMKEIKGKIKVVAGKLIGNKALEHKGRIQNASGKVEAAAGDLAAAIKNVVRKH